MLDRRTLMAGLAAVPLAAAMPPVPAAAFDPVAYIADLRAAGVTIAPCARRRAYRLQVGKAAGGMFQQVAARWASAQVANPANVERTFLALMAERDCADTRLMLLAAELGAIVAVQDALFAAHPDAECEDMPGYAALEDRLVLTLEAISTIAATSLRGWQAKARALQVPSVEQAHEWTGAIAASLADDLLRLGEVA